jgi:hypothetical protein
MMSDPHPIFDHPRCTVRLSNWLHAAYEEPINHHVIRCHLLSGVLHPHRTYGYGRKMHADLCAILNIDVASTRYVHVQPFWKFHPMTGQPLTPTTKPQP